MTRRILALVVSLVASVYANAATYVVPVVTARVNDRIYTTSLAFRNSTEREISCEAIYALPNDPENGTLRAAYAVAPQSVLIEDDTLKEAGAVGTLRIDCSSSLQVAARIRTSPVAATISFDDGLVFEGVDEDERFTNTTRTIGTSANLLLMEVGGAAVSVDILVRNGAGVVVGEKSFELAAYAQQPVNLSDILRQDGTVTVAATVSGPGAIVWTTPSRTSTLFERSTRSPGTASSHSTAQSPASVIDEVGAAAFHAAPFQEPATGLVYFRNRWYDPSTGSFVSPDPLGYGDSANLYAFGGGDPVNRRDPRGEAVSVASRGTFVVSDERSAAGATYRIPRAWAAANKTTMLQILVHVGKMTPTDAMNLMDGQGLTIATQGLEAVSAIALNMAVVDAALKEVTSMYAMTAVGVTTAGAGSALLAAGGATAFTATAGGLFTSGVAVQGTSDAIHGQFSGVESYLTAGATTVAVGWAFEGGAWALRNALSSEVGAIGPGTPSIILRENLKQAGVKPPPFPNAAHHIVAADAAAAEPARTHLRSFGIGVNDADNGVFLRFTDRGAGASHRHIHTGAYYAEVNARILATTSAEEARAALRGIARELQAGSFPF